MAILFHITQKLDSENKKKLLSQITPEDAVLFTQDGVYNRLDSDLRSNTYYLKNDVQSRGLSLDKQQILMMTQMSALLSQYQTSYKW